MCHIIGDSISYQQREPRVFLQWQPKLEARESLTSSATRDRRIFALKAILWNDRGGIPNPRTFSAVQSKTFSGECALNQDDSIALLVDSCTH